MDRITILVVDDHPLFRQGVVNVFSVEPELDVIGQADNGEDALEMIRSLRPAIAVLDVNLPR
jgi:DNA-binding NarL/FixJ family response regulator